MSLYAPNGLKLKIFLKEQNTAQSNEYPVEVVKSKGIPLTGDKAKAFYENLINESPSPKTEKPQLPVTTKPKPKPVTKHFKDSDLLWMAQNNDIKNLEIFFSQNGDHNVDVTDDFGWTPLMCASRSGAEDAVRILLENNADPNKTDRLGNTALKLAKQKQIREMLQCFKKPTPVEEAAEPVETFFCPTCKETLTMSKNKHESSTPHLFYCKVKTPTFYGIPETNKGFQLLLKEGWNKEKGLGPDGAGRKFPIKPVMKKDRTGIGAPVRVSEREMHHTQKYENKKIKRFKRWKEKDFERNYRLEFS